MLGASRAVGEHGHQGSHGRAPCPAKVFHGQGSRVRRGVLELLNQCRQSRRIGLRGGRGGEHGVGQFLALRSQLRIGSDLGKKGRTEKALQRDKLDRVQSRRKDVVQEHLGQIGAIQVRKDLCRPNFFRGRRRIGIEDGLDGRAADLLRRGCPGKDRQDATGQYPQGRAAEIVHGAFHRLIVA